ncbi:hypothetical protein GE09DRAFT_1270377 [Coniochaeta sp. 2T2.1]|nr:hypothetical protein GE09DRAFT_1270377 [Coniochaeta sp. 2T2.1]
MCFDGAVLLMLQFKADRPSSINDDKCSIDCWVLPRDNPNGKPLRVAFYRFLVQGIRRCQGMTRKTQVSLDGIRPEIVYFSGQPTHQQALEAKGWSRHLDVQYGAFPVCIT